jgi:hypothetical protein
MCHAVAEIFGLATTGFAPHNNNIEKGGIAHKILLTRVGQMQKAKKDSNKHVYKEDGTYHYPKIPENKLQMNGEMYFVSMEITGSNEGTAADPKFLLLKHWKETELPALDAMAQKIQSETGKQVIVHYLWDSATPHIDGILTEWLQKEFDHQGTLDPCSAAGKLSLDEYQGCCLVSFPVQVCYCRARLDAW